MVLGLTQPLTEMSTRNSSWGGGGVRRAGGGGCKPYHLPVPTVSKSGSLNLLEPSGLVQVCNGISLPCSLKDTSNCVFIFDIPSVCICLRLFAVGRSTATRVLAGFTSWQTHIIATFGQTGYCTMFKHLEEHVVDSAAFRSPSRPASVMYVGNWTVFVS